jgi:hypothetical protein
MLSVVELSPMPLGVLIGLKVNYKTQGSSPGFFASNCLGQAAVKTQGMYNCAGSYKQPNHL